jgi:hypothetical protein
MRPITPLAVENGVGKLAALKAPNASTEWTVLAAFFWKVCLLKRRRKAGQKGRSRREEHGAAAKPVKNLRNAGDVKNDTAGL